jgi:hypothetical protein
MIGQFVHDNNRYTRPQVFAAGVSASLLLLGILMVIQNVGEDWSCHLQGSLKMETVMLVKIWKDINMQHDVFLKAEVIHNRYRKTRRQLAPKILQER